FGYAPEHILFLSDDKGEPEVISGRPTLMAIRDAFQRWLPSRGMQADDSVLFFFAGHAMKDRDLGASFLVAADSRIAAVVGPWLPVGWLFARLEEVPCRHKLVLLDCSFAGDLFTFRQSLIPPTQAPSPRANGPASRINDEVEYYLLGNAFQGMIASS